jgi:hypothetical protein
MTLHELIANPAFGAILWWLFSSAVATMPTPQPMERWYGWFYNFLQRVGANHSLVVSMSKPIQ